MKHQDKLPHIARCGFCEQGLLRFMRCHSCTTVVAVCDECELVWLDIAAVKDDPEDAVLVSVPQMPGLPFQTCLLVLAHTRRRSRVPASRDIWPRRTGKN